MEIANHIVNTVIVLLCILGNSILLLNHYMARGQDRTAYKIIIGIVAAMIISSGIYTRFHPEKDLLFFWIETFFSTMCGLMMHYLYKVLLRQISRSPLILFIKSMAAVGILYMIITIIDLI